MVRRSFFVLAAWLAIRKTLADSKTAVEMKLGFIWVRCGIAGTCVLVMGWTLPVIPAWLFPKALFAWCRILAVWLSNPNSA
jgi:hypothetical protein